MQCVPNLTLKALGRAEVARLRSYARALRRACTTHPPPFGMDGYGETFRNRACDPQWMAESLLLNAQKEAEGAVVIWGLAGRVVNEVVSRQIQQHAVDESRHARMYVAILDTVFPTALPGQAARTLRRQFPTFSLGGRPPAGPQVSENEIADAMIQMNLGEIRTRINQLLLIPVLSAYCRPDRLGGLTRLLEAILADETSHVRYTARLIEQACRNGLRDFVFEMMRERMDDICKMTLSEVKGAVFAGA